MGSPIPVPQFEGLCVTCFPIADTTPEAWEVIFFDLELCPGGQAYPAHHPSWILRHTDPQVKDCFYFYQSAGFPPGWKIQLEFAEQLIPGPETELELHYHRPQPPVVVEQHFWSGHGLPTCQKIIQNTNLVCDCGPFDWHCSALGFAVCIPFPDPYPKKIITDLGWYDYENWLYERNFDASGWPVYRLHHADPWDTFSVKMDPTSPYS